MAIATVYGNAFAGAGVGQYGAAAAQAARVGTAGDLGPEPMPFERYVEIIEAQNAAAQKGQDANQVLTAFGLSAVDFSNVAGYWHKKQAQEAEKYHRLYHEYSAKYSGKYGTSDGLTQEQRQRMILDRIKTMAGEGQAQAIVAFLKDYFPDDANDNDALDWWLDKACDECAQVGDRARAHALLGARYPLQEDVDDPPNEWVASEMGTLFD